MSEAQATAPVQELAEKPSEFYRPELDLLRFIAFLSVFLFHGLWFAGWLPPYVRFGLQSGMCLFFMLSSYLITELLLRERQKTGRIHIKAFFVRRILRIWPLYFACLLLSVITGLVVKRMQFPTLSIVMYLLLVGNWYNVLVGPIPSPWQPLWSINLEEQFYLIWPFLAWVKERYLWIVSLATFPVAAAALVHCSGTVPDGPYGMAIWFNSLVQFQYFGLGAVLALVLKQRQPGLSLKLRGALILSSAILFCVAAQILIDGNAKTAASLIAGYFLIGCACAALFVGLLGLDKRFVPDWTVRLGKISYGLYVFHNPCLVAVWLILSRSALIRAHNTLRGCLDLVCAYILTYTLAKLSNRYFEAPFLRLKKRFEFVKSRPLE